LFKLLDYFIINILSNILMIVFMLVGIAYLTILERKILRYIQFRKGSNKVGFLGPVQPLRDDFKLLSKERGGGFDF